MDGQKQCSKLQDLFDCAASLYSTNTAVEFCDGSTKQALTYSHVKEQALHIQQYVGQQVLSKRSQDVKSNESPREISSDDCEQTRSATVGLYVSECCFVPSLVIGLLKAGVSFLPLNPLSPKSLIANTLDETRVKHVITSGDLQAKFCEDFSFFHLNLSSSFTLYDSVNQKHHFFLLVNEKVYHDNKHVDNLIPSDLAYVLSTSGTTGNPKLVYVPHKCILPNILHLRHIYEMTSVDRVALCSPLTFDPSIVELFVALSSGATLVIISNSVKSRPSILAEILFEVEKVSVMQCTPTLINRFDSAYLRNIFSGHSTLRIIVFGGESCPSYKQIKSWIDSDSLLSSSEKENIRFYNIYGITEVSSWSTYFEIRRKDIVSGSDDSISLGYPLLDTILEIVNKEGETLCRISSTVTHNTLYCNRNTFKMIIYNDDQWKVANSLASVTGYLKVGGESRLCYVKDGSDDALYNIDQSCMRSTGDVVKLDIDVDNFNKLCSNISTEGHSVNYALYYIGRTDGQIKRHGKRMNVLTVKQKLDEMKLVSSSHVVNFKTNNERPESSKAAASFQNGILCAFIVLQDGHKNVSKESIFHILKDVVNAHYIPDEIVILDQFPMTNHGKVDEDALATFLKVTNNGVTSLTGVDGNLQLMVVKNWWKVLNKVFEENDMDFLNISDYLQTNFIEHGGDSFGAVKLISMLHNELNNRQCSFDEPHLFELILNGTLQQVLEFIAAYGDTTKNVRSCSHGAVAGEPFMSNTSLNKRRKRHYQPYHLPLQESRNDTPTINCISLRRGNLLLQYGLRHLNDPKSSLLSKRLCITSPLHGVNKPRLRLCEKWKFDSQKCIDASPLAVLPSNDPQQSFAIIGSHSHLLASIHITSGLQKWQTKLGGRIESSVCLTPCGRYVVVGCYDHYVYILETSNGSVVWKFETGDQVKSSPCPGPLNSSLVFIGSHDGWLYCLNVQRRSVEWKYNAGHGAVYSSPLYYQSTNEDSLEDVVFSCTLSGLAYCVSATDGIERWSTKLPKPIFSSAALCKTGVCVGCVDHYFYMMDRVTGVTLWKFETNQPVFSSPAIFPVQSQRQSEELIVCGSHDGETYCIRGKDGSLVWSYPGSNQTKLPPVFATPFPTTIVVNSKSYDVVVTASTNGTISVLSIHDGHCLTQTQLPGHVFSSPLVIGHDNEYNLIVGCRNDYLYCFSIDLDD